MNLKFTIYVFFGLLTVLKSSTLVAQCSVTAPTDVTINCGQSTSLVANTNIPTYSYTSSSCPPVAITGTNAFPTACDDCVTGDINIGFPFNFYGNTYTNLRIQSNGIVGFGGLTYTGFSGFTIPASGNPNNYIAGLYADIDIRCGGTITYQLVGTSPNRKFVVSYNNVAPYGSGSPTCDGTGTASFQIILNENGSFQTIITQLSSNWESTWGTEITQGVENIDGTYAVATSGRNDQTQPGIGPGATDCYIFNPGVCVFQRWELNGVSVSTNPTYSVNPTVTTAYTAVWNCAGSTCSDNTSVIVNGPTITPAGVVNNSNCLTANGSFNLSLNNFANGTYTLNYTLGGAAQTRSVTISSSSQLVSFTGLNVGTYANFSITSGCNSAAYAGPISIINAFVTPIISVGSIVNGSDCTTPNGSFTISVSGLSAGTHTVNYLNNGAAASTTVTAGALTNIAQNTTFNSGTFSSGNPTFNRPSTYDCPNSFGTAVYYNAYTFVPSTTGSYTFNNTFSGDGYGLLYQTSFNPASPCSNFLLADDDGNAGSDPRLTRNLTAGVTYVLVTTTFANSTTGNFSWQYTGPGGATIGASSGVVTSVISGLSAGTYTNFTIGTGCNAFTLPGPISITSPGAPLTTGATVCVGGSGSLVSPTVCGGGSPQTQTATGSGGTSNTTAYTGGTDINIAFPALPGGATVTAVNVRISYTSSYASELRVEADPPAGTTQTDIAPSGTSNVALGTWSTANNPVGNWRFRFRETYDDAGTDATITNITITVTYTLPSTIQWYTVASGGTAIGSGTPFNPVGVSGSGLANTNTSGSTTYYAACSSSSSCRTAATFLISPASTAPTGVIGGTTVCPGTSVTLGITGGSLGVGSNWEWSTTNFGSVVGTGSTLTVTPIANTTYYVRASAIGSCAATATVNGAITISSTSSNLSTNNQTKTCIVNQNGYVHFYSDATVGTAGQLILSINSLGQNLGNVKVTSFVNAQNNAIAVPACGAYASVITHAMGRRWLVDPEFQPVTPITVALHFKSAEYTKLQTAANGNANPDDNLSAIGDLKLSKYSGPLNEDNVFANNCVENGGNGGTTIHSQSSNLDTDVFIATMGNNQSTTIFSIPSFSELWLHGTNGSIPLPVTLSSFSGQCNDNDVTLKWTTQSETNSKKFIIEKLRDGIWYPIGEVLSAGSSNGEKSYSFKDNLYSSAENYYRLNQIDLNGISTVYEELLVSCNILLNSLSIFPNPNEGEFTIEINSINSIKNANIVISDISGKIIYSELVSLNKGVNQFHLNKFDLSTGTYLVHLKNLNEDFKPSLLIKK
ncbi:MAG: T9SS type A sorting domain-containing protein [Bacteroidota bacterium]